MSDQDDPPRPLLAPAVPLANILSTPCPSANWLWDGFLSCGKVTLLTSLWKMGKTTLLSVLLAKMKGGGELAGLANLGALADRRGPPRRIDALALA